MLYAANNSRIDTYGDITLTLDLGLRRQFSWKFVIANVSRPIFLVKFGLLVDIQRNRLIDSITSLQSMASVEFTPLRISTITNADHDSNIYHLLKKFVCITQQHCTAQGAKHDVLHYIETNGSPVFNKPRRLSPE